jgi:hypothetical protein
MKIGPIPACQALPYLSVMITVFPVVEGIGEVVSVTLRYRKGNLAQRNSIALVEYSGVSSSYSSATST